MAGKNLRSEPIPFITLPNWVKAAARCGFNIEPVFRKHGIQTDLIHLESVSVDARQIEKVMEDCIARSRGPHFPFVLGEMFAFEYLPDLETFVSTAPTLREAAKVFVWVRTLINPLIDVHLVERGKQAMLVMSVGQGNAKPYFTESLFAAIIRFARLLLGTQGQIGKLTFRHRAPKYAAEYPRYFGLPVEFGRREDAAVFDRKLLDLPLRGAYPSLHRQAEFLVERRIKNLPSRPTLVAAIEQALAQKPELLGRGVGEMAAQLGLHPRALQRRLRVEGQSYAQIQDHARYREAMNRLQDGRDDLDTISERLGFSDRRAFTRAFRRWSGQTPSGFRARGRP